MGKFSLATKLSDELGVSFAKASRFVDDVGLSTARATFDEAIAAGSRTVSDLWKPATAGGLIIGGGTLAWRQQDLEQARTIAAQQKEYSSALASIMEADLSPAVKRELVRALRNSVPSDDSNEPNESLLGGDIQTTIVLLVVLVFALKFGLEGGVD